MSWFTSSERRHRTDKDASPEGVGNDLGHLCIALNKGLSGAVLPKRCKRHYKPRRLPRNFVPLGNWPLASATDTPLARRSTLPLALVASPEYSAQEIMAAGEKYA